VPLQIVATDRGYRLGGELDLATADDLLTAIRSHEAGEPLDLDFSQVTFMDSSGLRAILEAAGERRNGVLVIVDPTPQVRRVLDISLPDGAPGLEIRGGGEGGVA
jgi:anti-anti-sigma factor